MTQDNERLLVYFEDEEHLVRRLGAAVVSCWGDLPKPMQDKLLEQAKRVLDEAETGSLDEQLKRLIGSHLRSSDRRKS